MTEIVGHIDLSEHETRENRPEWMKAGLQETRTGYGRRLNSGREVKYGGRWRRIYVCQMSNAGTSYILSGKDWIVCR